MVVMMTATCHPEAQDVMQDGSDNIIGRDRGMYFPCTGNECVLMEFASI